MVFDRLERLAQYKGLNPNLDTLIDYALSHDLNALVPGRNDVDGDNCWMSRNVAELKPETALFERHLEYIDLQIPLEAGEIVTVAPVEALAWPESDAETRFTEGTGGTQLDFIPGTFAIFFPGDAHCCGLSGSGETRVSKLVGKARA